MNGPRIGSACSGYGGLDEAITQVMGGQVAWHVEYDDAPSRLLARRYPETPNHHDLTMLDWATVEPVSLLCAGYPCQPFGLSGKREGVNDARHLWPYLGKGKPDKSGRISRPGAVAVLRPQFVVGENVRGHLSLGFDHVLADLHDLGYDASWTVAKASGVADGCHARARLFFVATDRDQGDAVSPPYGEPVAVTAGGRWNLPHEGLFGVVPFTGDLPTAGVIKDGAIFPMPALHDSSPMPLLPTPRTSDTTGPGIHGNGGMDLRTAISLLPNTDGPVRWGIYSAAVERWASALGRPAPSPHMASATGERQLSPLFVEWMQGLPAGHVTDVPGLTRAQQIKMLGNGVCPQQGAATLRYLLTPAMAVAA